MGRVKFFLVCIFSFFLGFGKFDPFLTNGLYFDVLTIITFLALLIHTDLKKQWEKYKKQLLPLFAIGFILFFLGVHYGPGIIDKHPFNLKYFSAVIIFWLLSFTFENAKIRNYAFLLFSVSCGLLALLYYLNFFTSVSEIRNNRLIIFGENPNSISTRMALAFIILLYFCIENPLKLSLIRFLTLGFIPFLFLFVIETGSRGSFLIMLLGGAVLLIFSKLKFTLKIFLLGLCFILGSYYLYLLYDTGLYERFLRADITGGREDIWFNALSIFYEYPFGTGEGGYTTEMFKRFSDTSDTHNIFIYLLISGGFISLLLFLYFLISLLRKSISAFRNGNSLNITLLIFMVLLASKTGGVLTYLILWYFFAVINSYKLEKYKVH